MLSLLRVGRKHKNYSNPFRIRLFLFLSYLFEIETIKMFIQSRSFLENPNPIPDQNGQSVYPFSDQNGTKTPPCTRWGGTYKGVPPRALQLGSAGRRFSPVFRGVNRVSARLTVIFIRFRQLTVEFKSFGRLRVTG